MEIHASRSDKYANSLRKLELYYINIIMGN